MKFRAQSTTLAAALIGALGVSAAQGVETRSPADDLQYLQLVAPLDETRSYCIDISGYGGASTIKFDEPLQTHTCKERFEHDDQVVDPQRSRRGQLYFARHDRCMSAAADGSVRVAVCAPDSGQQWRLGEDGTVRPASAPTRCLTAGPDSQEAGTPPEIAPKWRSRKLALLECDAALAERQRWRLAQPQR